LWRGDHDGLIHAAGRDFINLWTASQWVEANRAADIFDQGTFAAAQRQPMGPASRYISGPFRPIPCS